MEETIRKIIARYYKRAIVHSVIVEGEDIRLKVEGVKGALLTKRLLDEFPEARWVFIDDGSFMTSVYTRETLKWLGY